MHDRQDSRDAPPDLATRLITIAMIGACLALAATLVLLLPTL